MNKTLSKLFFSVALFFGFCFSFLTANAMYLKKFNRPIVDVLNDLAKSVLSIAGGLAVFILAFAGIYYATSYGNSDKQEKAKKMIRFVFFGLILILASYALLIKISTIVIDENIYISNTSVAPNSGPPGTIFTIKATITSPAGVDAATTLANIQSPDETDVDTILLVDDGTNGDATAGDGIYTGTWTTGAIGPYFVDITACDINGNCAETENI